MNDIAMEIGGKECAVPEIAADQLNRLQRRCQQLEVLAEEVWSAMAGFMLLMPSRENWTEEQIKQEVMWMHVDRRLRAAGLKRFPPTEIREGHKRRGG